MENWTEVTIWTSAAGIDAVTGMLMDLGIDGFVIEDAQDFADFLQDTELYWDYVDEDLAKQKSSAETNVKIYIEDSPAGAELLAQVHAGLRALRDRDAEHAFGRCAAELASIRQEDWENNWKQYFKPFCVGKTFLIKPSWETVDEPQDGRRILEIDPSSSFGTGTHNTTQLCICELESLVRGGERLLDMGCGSGILSVAAHMLGAADITAVDIDANAARIAAENAEKNGFALRTFVGDVIGDRALSEQIGGAYDIIDPQAFEIRNIQVVMLTERTVAVSITNSAGTYSCRIDDIFLISEMDVLIRSIGKMGMLLSDEEKRQQMEMHIAKLGG